jgi:hypothetical protein
MFLFEMVDDETNGMVVFGLFDCSPTALRPVQAIGFDRFGSTSRFCAAINEEGGGRGCWCDCGAALGWNGCRSGRHRLLLLIG